MAVFNTGSTKLLVVRGLPNKRATQGVAAAAKLVLGEVNSMAGEQLVVRFHTDAGSDLEQRSS
eukprot:8918744-Prorocentrum_lima.AAC.1